MGFPPVLTSTAPGDYDGQIDVLTADNVPGGIVVNIKNRATYAQYFVIILDGNIIDTIYVNALTSVPVFVTTDGTHTLIAQPNGEWQEAFTDAADTAIAYYGTDSGRTIRFRVTPTLQYLQEDISAVEVTATDGAIRNRNINLDSEGRKNWASFDFTCTDLGGGNYRLDITARGITVATATGTAGTIIALPVNGSGLTVTATVAGAGTGTTYIRWPEKYVVSWSFSPSDTHTIYDDGTSNLFIYTTPIFTAGGAYSCFVVQYDDNDNISSTTGTTVVTLSGFPKPPTNLTYDSGSAASTVIDWTAPATGPAPDSYNVYTSWTNAENFLDTFAATQNVATTSATVIGVIGGYAFTGRVIVRSVYAGIVEQNLTTLEINFDAAGNRIPPAPNTPILFGSPNATERAFEVTASYNPESEETAPDTIDLYVWEASGAADWSTVYDSVAYSTDPQGIPTAYTLDSGTLPGGWGNTLVNYGFRAVTGAVTDGNENIYGPVEITDTGTSAPTAIIEAGA